MRNAATITQGGLGLLLIFTLITLYAWYAEHDHETLYRAEIMEHIVDPCYTEAAKMLYGKMTPAEALERLKAASEKETQEIMEATIPLLAGRDTLEERMEVYGIGRRSCLEGGQIEMRRQGSTEL